MFVGSTRVLLNKFQNISGTEQMKCDVDSSLFAPVGHTVVIWIAPDNSPDRQINFNLGAANDDRSRKQLEVKRVSVQPELIVLNVTGREVVDEGQSILMTRVAACPIGKVRAASRTP